MADRLLTPTSQTPSTTADGPAAPAGPDRARLDVGPVELHTAPVERLVEAALALLPPISERDRTRSRTAVRAVTGWLAGFDGPTWQARWVASSADRGGQAWPEVTDHSRRTLLFKGTEALVCLGVIHPDYPWLLDNQFQSLFTAFERTSDPAGFARVRQAAAAAGASQRTVDDAVRALCRIRITLGKPLAALTGHDLVDYDAAVRAGGRASTAAETLWRALHDLDLLPGPATLKAARRAGPASVEELVDRYGLACRAVRDLLVGYIAERAAELDYVSISNLAFWLAKLFWADLEAHHPGISTLQLAPDVARAWKQRVAVRPDGRRRGNRHQVLNAVRAFYADVNQWAYEDPARWAIWAAPCPITKADVAAHRKHRAELTARMHARTRTLAPLLPRLVATATSRHAHAAALLDAARHAAPGVTLIVDGRAYQRLGNRTAGAAQVLVRRLPHEGGKPFDAAYEEAEAFWAWAAIEVLRLSGLRIEEALELTHLSIRRYTQPNGEVVPLLQVAPSKTDAERVFPISPELARVLARIIDRVRASDGRVPLTSRYDTHERVFGPRLPHLFQRPAGAGHQVFSPATVRNWLLRTVALTGLVDVDGQPIRITPHDFRRLFATDAVNSGLPIHIAAAVLGHRAVDTTRGYTAVYPEEVIRAYQAFILTRRAARPGEEYREPTDAEWAEFERHFTVRKVALGNCDRPYGTGCIHEHACARCPMLRPEPSRLGVFAELEANLTQRLAEARERVWLGEVAGLEQTLEALRGKRQHAQRLADQGLTDTPVGLG